MNVEYSQGVFEELVGVSVYIADADEGAAHRFLDACDATFRFLAENPLAGSQRDFGHPRLANVRMWRVNGFEKYLIYYLPIDSGVKILHVVHHAREGFPL